MAAGRLPVGWPRSTTAWPCTKNVLHTYGILPRLLIGCPIRDFCRIENRHGGHLPNRLFERKHLLVVDRAAKNARERTKIARMRMALCCGAIDRQSRAV
jgi:hypothetical protein